MRFSQTQLENMIENLSFEQFREFVKLFLRDVMENASVELIDGTNDGGNDCRVFADGTLVKRGFQITVQKERIKGKIDSDVAKTAGNVKNNGYAPELDFYYSRTVSGDKKNEFENLAIKQHGIKLRIFDRKYLASEIDRSPRGLAFLVDAGTGGAVKANPNMPKSDMERTVYELLAGGGKINDLKSEFIYSFMLCRLYDNDHQKPEELADYLNSTLHCEISGYFITTYYADRTADLVIDGEGSYSLTPDARNNIDTHRATSVAERAELERSVTSSLAKYQIENVDASLIIDSLEKIYARNADLEIPMPGKDNSIAFNARMRSIAELKSIVLKANPGCKEIDNVVKEIIELSGENDYLSKLTNTYLFSTLLKSSDLDKYVSAEIRRVWIDTQVLLPMICVLSHDCDYSEFQYQSAKSLFEKAEKVDGNVQFYTSDMYVEEVAVHFWEALAVSRLERSIDIDGLGGSRNYFYNFFQAGNGVGFFAYEYFYDFIDDLLGTSDVDLLTRKEFIGVVSKSISECLEGCNIQVLATTKYDSPTYEPHVQKLMSALSDKGRHKPYISVKSDVKSVMLLSEKGLNLNPETGLHSEPYLVSWDASLRIFNSQFRPDGDHGAWMVYSPLQLANRLSVMNFKVDPALLSYEIVSLTEKNFGSAQEKRRFIDTLALFVDRSDASQWKLGQKLRDLKISSRENLPDKEINEFGPKNALDSVLTKIYETYTAPKRSPGLSDLTAAMHDENNADAFYDIIVRACNNWEADKRLSDALIQEIDKLIAK